MNESVHDIDVMVANFCFLFLNEYQQGMVRKFLSLQIDGGDALYTHTHHRVVNNDILHMPDNHHCHTFSLRLSSSGRPNA